MAEAPTADDDRPSLLFLLVDALAFLVRRRGLFLVIVLPIAGLAAAIAWLLTTQRPFEAWRGHWGWDFLFVLVYAMFLDRWIKETLLDGATDCEEVDNLRRSIVSPGILALAAGLFAITIGLSVLPWPGSSLVPLVLCVAIAALLALWPPALAAAEPLGLVDALRLGRPVRSLLIVLVLGAVLLALGAAAAVPWALVHLPPHLQAQPWVEPALAAAHRLVDCAVLALLAHVVATLFRRLADWRAPEPDDHPYRDLGRPRRRFRAN